jgi:hypothetical protein
LLILSIPNYPMYRTSATDFVPPMTPASMMGGGGKKPLRGGGRLGVSYLPERPVGGMLGRMPYGPTCIPVFDSKLLYEGIAQGGGAKSKQKEEKDCGCDSKERHNEWLYKLIEKPNPHGGNRGEQRGGALITQFSGVSHVGSTLFAGATISQLIPIIVLAFAHSYFIQYGKSKKQKTRSGFTLYGGGENAFDKEKKMREFAQILQPLGRTNLQTLASILTLHYFSVKHLMAKKSEPVLHEGVFKAEMKIKEVLGDEKTYQDLEKIFLSSSQEGGGSKKLRSLIKPIGKTGFLANGMLIKMKKLFQSFHHVAHDEKKDINKMKQNQKKTLMAFKSLFDHLSPISVGMKIAREESQSRK